MLTLAEVGHEHGFDLEKAIHDNDPRYWIEREQAAGMAFGPFHRQFQLERAPEKVRLLLAKAAKHRELVAAKQSFATMDQLDGAEANLRTAINTTTTETNLWDPALFHPIPANDMRSGKVYGGDFGGVMGTTATPTISWTMRVGTNNSAPPTGTTMGAGPTVTLGTFTAQPFYGSYRLSVRLIGVAASTAALAGTGYAVMPAAAAATVTPHAVFGGALPTTVDRTVAQGIGVSIIWGTSNGSNTLTPHWIAPYTLN
jgi:hypothetical protein